VNEINDAELIESLRRQMTKSVARQVAAAGNLANLDTPGYKAVEPSFADALDGQLALTKAGTSAGLKAAADEPPRMKVIENATARRDGNTVEMDRELLTLSRAAGDFSAAQTALAAKFRLVRYAINEGR
jgi:flagellar basal-body rod protein FlgB